ncbi:transcriptional regulator [Micromonospora sp. ATCC 39149]|uniref:Helix-turn-helix domain-containing protein n=1 Tax=Micromonospora carbonacea TaxID=47853 RepID=A0A7D5Y6K2_9ACTN|nr:helix-turn-helix domain-containing protein [Micromonospora sp. ATCC 39149]EEP70346.1 transcriptional regulator [Micromonospora sp. ATCC 39149]QLJ96759.1 helix-turn-helix domain-containing protein [Micromonospora carbonacea]
MSVSEAAGGGRRPPWHGRHHAPQEQPGADRAWLTQGCEELLRAPAGDQRGEAAARLGARAADEDLYPHDLVNGVFGAVGRCWSTSPPEPVDTPTAVHARAATLLDAAHSALVAALDGYLERARADLVRHRTERAAFVNDLLTGRAEPGRLAERAHRYGIRLSATHTVLAARAPRLTADIVHRVDVALAARFGEGNTLTTLRDGDLVCISAGGLRGIGAELAHLLLTELGPDGWQVAVGRPHPGVHGLVASLDEARNALDHAGKLGFTAPVLNAADLLVFPVLLRDRDAITDLVTTVLGPLTGARGGAQPYLDTLTVLFDNQGNHTATARQMHLSVRAVTYRLDRIHHLTGYHPNEPTQRFTLHAAVLGARLLGWPEGAAG